MSGFIRLFGHGITGGVPSWSRGCGASGLVSTCSIAVGSRAEVLGRNVYGSKLSCIAASPVSSPSHRRLYSSGAPPPIDAALRQDIEDFAAKKPYAVSMEEVLNALRPWKMAKFLQSELPVRYAERIRWIEVIPDWHLVPGLVDVHDKHIQTFLDLRNASRKPTLDAFTAVIQAGVDALIDVQTHVAASFHKLRAERGEDFGPSFADPWINNFMLNVIGCEMLMAQYLAIATHHFGKGRGDSETLAGGLPAASMKPTVSPQAFRSSLIGANGRMRPRSTIRTTGIIDPSCDVAEICRQTAKDMNDICEEYIGRIPLIKVEAHSQVSSETGKSPTVSYVPGHVRYILLELLKNSCRATADAAKTPRELQKRPITIIVCADEQNIGICVRDMAKGIPFGVGQQIWSYLYSTAPKKEEGVAYEKQGSELAGFGVGLPLSKLYAQYLGGTLDIVSLPGYGTDAYVFLKRLGSDLVEVVPDDDN